MKKWQFQEAKSKLSEVINYAVAQVPQKITVRGKNTVVILSIETYKTIISPTNTFIEFLSHSPLYDLDIDIERSSSLCRDTKL